MMAYSAHESRSSAIPVTITSGPHRKVVGVDQTELLPPGKPFRRIATAQLKAGVESTVVIENKDTSGFVVLDALQVLPASRK